MVLAFFHGTAKKKDCDIERIGRTAKYWESRPSDYFPELSHFSAFLLDEACAVAVEAGNKERDEKEKREKEEKKRAEQFQREMDKSFGVLDDSET